MQEKQITKDEAIRQQRILSLLFLIEKKGFGVLEHLSTKAVSSILIRNDWKRNGGKLGYRGLSSKYGLTESQIRTICVGNYSGKYAKK